ncbi:hypothetical protein O9G_002620 [Rozella allomycis CSF55]|uniref:Uncharacterized protein n=1 Tax=Rozella allomycis (strain CSF55) TaxID=988480 RepID=A0A075ATU8_ROZAC|nr:hypothetical protein O9G_002620 [Rozella allomycis CSF55]|eukprot:EPZ32125.1 hypothetical protein O9G_002620 [Rozella allomycis CSF55]
MKQDQFQPNVIYHFESSNDGFNLACYPEAGDTQGPGKVTWNIATRCITHDTTTKELITSVARQMTLTLDQYGGSQFSDRQSYLVVALKGDIGANFVGSQVPKNCIILTSEHLAACYGKSLVDYMLFLD